MDHLLSREKSYRKQIELETAKSLKYLKFLFSFERLGDKFFFIKEGL